MYLKHVITKTLMVKKEEKKLLRKITFLNNHKIYYIVYMV